MAKYVVMLAFIFIAISIGTMIMKVDPLTSIIVNAIMSVISGASMVLLYIKFLSKGSQND